MKIPFHEPLIEKHKTMIQHDNTRVSEVFELLIACCTLGLLAVSYFQKDYSRMTLAYLAFAFLSFGLYLVTRFYIRKHLEYTNLIVICVLAEAYAYSIFSGILFNRDGASITVYALMAAACSAYMVPISFTYVFHSIVAIIYCALALLLKPEYGVQDTINYVAFLSMSFILVSIIYKARLDYLRTIDDANGHKEIAESSQYTLKVALESAKVLSWRYDHRTKTITDSGSLGERFSLPKVVENVPQTILDMGFVDEGSKKDFLYLYELEKQDKVAKVEVNTTVPVEEGTAWYRQIYTPTFDSEGKYAGSIGIAMDITEQKVREQRYEELLQLNRAARKDAVAIASYNLSKDLVTEYDSGNPELKKLLQHRTANDMLQSTKDTIYDPEERKKFAVVSDTRTMIHAFQNGTSHIEIVHHLQDSTRWMKTTFDMIENPYTGDIEAISALYDITESIRADLIVNQLVAVDYQSIMIIDVNTGWAQPFREKAEDQNLKEAMQRQESAGNCTKGLESFLRAYAVPGTEERVVRENSMDYILKRLEDSTYYETMYSLIKEGHISHYRVIYSYFENEKGTLFCAIQDVTDMYEQEERQKAEAEAANRAKTAFLSRVSHDMRTPLNGILGLTTLLKECVTSESGRQDLKELELSGKYLLNLINDTLDVSKIESGRLELHPMVCDGKSVFQNSFTMLQSNLKGKGIQLNIHAEKLPFDTLYIDAGRIEQVVMNVVGNAIKFTPPGGQIDISMRNLSQENGVITDELIIQDSGIGMSETFLPHIFETFSQEDATRTSMHQGTGLGMAITKQILLAMGGDIHIESASGKGTKVIMTLPLQKATAAQIAEYEKTKVHEEHGEILQGKRVLLCEDHPLNTKIATRLLNKKGMLVEHAENGQAGMEMFKASKMWYYDVILMDIRMPVMDGLDATRAIRKLPREDAKHIPVIAMTANAFEDDRRQTKEAGMDAHLSKPIQTELLYETIEQLIESKGGY